MANHLVTVLALLLPAVGCTVESPKPPPPPDQAALLAGVDCEDPGWGYGYDEEMVALADEYDTGCSDDPWDAGGDGGGSIPIYVTYTKYSDAQFHDAGYGAEIVKSSAFGLAQSACLGNAWFTWWGGTVVSHTETASCPLISTDYADPDNPVKTYDCSGTSVLQCQY